MLSIDALSAFAVSGHSNQFAAQERTFGELRSGGSIVNANPLLISRFSPAEAASTSFLHDTTFACAFMVGTAVAGYRVLRRKRQGKRPRCVDDGGTCHRACVRRADGSVAAPAANVGVVLLSAGSGKRMGANIPKQYLKLRGLEIALHSFDTFLKCPCVAEVVVVCDESWRYIFESHVASSGLLSPVVRYTCGGAERQDSMANGLSQITSEFVAIHDAARPLVTVAEVQKVVADAEHFGAAVLAVPTKATIKQAAITDGSAFVVRTPDRSSMWEAHTPQVVRVDLLRKGLSKVKSEGLTVTDDVSVVEAFGDPVKITEGLYTNLKVTTPEDIAVAESILLSRGSADAV